MCLFGKPTLGMSRQRSRMILQQEASVGSRMPTPRFKNRITAGKQWRGDQQYDDVSCARRDACEPIDIPEANIIGHLSEQGNKLFGVADKFRTLQMKISTSVT